MAFFLYVELGNIPDPYFYICIIAEKNTIINSAPE